jgi:hypothetical protein
MLSRRTVGLYPSASNRFLRVWSSTHLTRIISWRVQQSWSSFAAAMPRWLGWTLAPVKARADGSRSAACRCEALADANQSSCGQVTASRPQVSSDRASGPGRGPLPAISVPTSKISAREIVDADVAAVGQLLGRGLGYPAEFYYQLLDRLSRHPTPAGFSKYGYLLESDGTIVGVILLIFSTIWATGESSIRCHVTSWYVEPPFRSFATLFFAKVLKRKDVTYINISARPDTLPILKVQGFSKYSNGQFVSFPLLNLCSRSSDIKVEVMEANRPPSAYFEPFEHDLLLAHAEYGCISVWCTALGRAYPFVFYRRRFKGFVPGAQLAYCRDVKEFVRFARPLGLFLAARGIVLVRIDSNGPIEGLAGKYCDGMDPRYYKGRQPRLGDIAFTQRVMCPDIRRRKPKS